MEILQQDKLQLFRVQSCKHLDISMQIFSRNCSIFVSIDHGASILMAEYFHQVMGGNSFVGKSEQKNLNELAL